MDGFEHMSAESGSGQNDSSSASDASQNGSATDGAFLALRGTVARRALRHADDRQACIGAVNSGLARIIHTHQMAIERGIESCKTSMMEEPSIERAMASHAGLLRQWHAMMSFEARLEQMRLDAEKLEAQRQSDPLLETAR